MAALLADSRARRYSVNEILSLRTSLPVINCVVEKLNEHPDIGEISRIPEQALDNPERIFSQSQSLVDVTNRRKASHWGSKQTGGSSEQIEEQAVSSTTLTRDASRQWHLRPRDSSHHSSEPQSAPSSVAAQHSENFQRFYKAVISPTHVRVTAGGRIVPNTRAIAPPRFDWNPDKCLFEPRRPLPHIEQNYPAQHLQNQWLQPQNIPQSPVSQNLLSACFPSYNFPPQGQSTSQPTMATQKLSGFPGNDQNMFDNGMPQNEVATGSLQSGILPQPIKISPPSQFDHSKPFVFNGRVVYPVPAGFQPPPNAVPLPITVLGDPNFPHQAPVQSAGGFIPPQFPNPVPMASFVNHIMMPSGQPGHLPMMIANRTQTLEGLPPRVPHMFQHIPGILSLSELTKAQIQSLRTQVKHIDSQLANNKHQIDEPFLRRQRSEFMGLVDRMETMLQTQLGQEGSRSSMAYQNDKIANTDKNPHQIITTETLPSTQLTCGSNSTLTMGREGDTLKTTLSSIASSEELKKDPKYQDIAPPVPLFVPTALSSTIQTKPQEIQAAGACTAAKLFTRSEPGTKSRLSAAAAMAPPFQPRAHVMIQSPESSAASDAATGGTSLESQPLLPSINFQASMTAYAALGNRRMASGDQLMFAEGDISLPREHTMHIPHLQEAPYAAALMQQSNSLYAQAETQESARKGPAISPSAVPYLVGILPHGIPINDAHRSELVYSRPLTDEEIRARYLYWGDAPRSALKGSGLPKFDGKDFYPPSPVKGTALLASPAVSSKTNGNSTAVYVPDFENLFTEPGVPESKTPSRICTRSSPQHMMPTPTQVFLDNSIIGFQSPSPRPATYRFENSTTKGWPTDLGIDGEVAQNAFIPPSVTAIANSTPSDFSHLFMERGVPGSKSPSSPAQQNDGYGQSLHNFDATLPITPRSKASKEGEEDETRTLDSWGAPRTNVRWISEESEDLASSEATKNCSQSNASTIEIHLSPNDKRPSPKRTHVTTFAEKVTNLTSNDQQTQFLQSMLRNTVATMAAPALSGAVSSATAQGILPQYRGSAAASLAPAMLHSPLLEREDDSHGARFDPLNMTTSGVAPLIAANFLPENRPLNRDRAPRPIRASPNTMGAEGYMRYLSQKADDDKKILEQGWNSKTTGTGPVMGSDW